MVHSRKNCYGNAKILSFVLLLAYTELSTMQMFSVVRWK
jgi:hypothetical protein